MTKTANPAKESLRQEQAQQKRAAKGKSEDAALTDALKDTFPASDPVAAQAATKPGKAGKPKA
jgi:hypothetical protein